MRRNGEEMVCSWLFITQKQRFVRGGVSVKETSTLLE